MAEFLLSYVSYTNQKQKQPNITKRRTQLSFLMNPVQYRPQAKQRIFLASHFNRDRSLINGDQKVSVFFSYYHERSQICLLQRKLLLRNNFLPLFSDLHKKHQATAMEMKLRSRSALYTRYPWLQNMPSTKTQTHSN